MPNNPHLTLTCDPTKCDWTCMFGDIGVPVEIIQEGVICCQAPSCLPGKVVVGITSGNQEACSKISELVQMLLSDQVTQKRESPRTDLLASSIVGEDSWDQVIEALLDGSVSSSSATDWVLEGLLKDKL
ncbi:hypothetical protein L6452_28066 [Arctium lappa]|uniref:Uncharacterized protein n=1 Tax=Arctium lappa TaxID=4217 RepID=A0ACB8ZXX5_ARCLA|nr:hypothetical protein L6452_28066 [Arctium lappa]